MTNFESSRKILFKFRKPIVKQCGECNNIEKAPILINEKESIVDSCKIFLSPETQWRLNTHCQRSTKFQSEVTEEQSQKKVNPIKWSKRH